MFCQQQKCCFCCWQSTTVATEPCLSALQRSLEITDDQKAALCQLRRGYVTKMALVAKHRRQLLEHLQFSCGTVSLSAVDTEARAKLEEHIKAQLHDCLVKENQLFVWFMGTLGHQVRPLNRACPAEFPLTYKHQPTG